MPTKSSVPETVTSHTPGPWHYEPLLAGANADPDLEPREDDLFWIVNTAGVEHVLATVHRYPVEQAEANARLIAAAPELLGCLRALVDHLQSWKTLEVEGGWIRQSLAAIAKAEGP